MGIVRWTQEQVDTLVSIINNKVEKQELAAKADNSALAAKAPLLSPVFLGTPTVPTPSVQDRSTKAVNAAFVSAYVNQNLVVVSGIASVSTFTNASGWIANLNANSVDIFPPKGFVMAECIGFIASPRNVLSAPLAGQNHLLLCRHERLTDRFRVQVGAIPLKALPIISYLSIWRKK